MDEVLEYGKTLTGLGKTEERNMKEGFRRGSTVTGDMSQCQIVENLNCPIEKLEFFLFGKCLQFLRRVMT